jgi:hypothetical protein
MTHYDPHTIHERHNARSGQGPVVLDVGGDVGALVLVASPDDLGAEIEISAVGCQTRSHVAVFARQLGGRTVHAAVYPQLVAGDHQLWAQDGRPAMTVAIKGGEVTVANWTGSPAGHRH